MKRLSSAAVALAAVVVLGLAVVASADTTTVSDPQGDTTGGVLDLKSATAGHTSTGRLKHTVVQYNNLNHNNLPAVVMNSPTKGCASGYAIWPRTNATKLYKPCTATFVCCYATSFPNPKTVVYTFPKSAIGNPAHYYWAIRIFGSGETNIDVLPNRGNPRAVCPWGVTGGVCNSGWAQWMVLHQLP